MANPQVEDGHTDIANEIVEALAKKNLSSQESRILWALFRKTYGWHKKVDHISLSQFSSMTGILPQHINRTVKQLELRKIIIISRNGSTNEYQFQKNYEIWDTMLPVQVVPNEVVPKQVLPDTVLPNEDAGTTKRGNQVLPNEVLTKETITKETIQKKGADKKLSSPIGERVKEVFAQLDKLRGYRPTKRNAEAASIIRMLKSYSLDQIIKTWQTLKADKFYATKELFMMTVESQIGAVISGGNNGENKGSDKTGTRKYTRLENITQQ